MRAHVYWLVWFFFSFRFHYTERIFWLSCIVFSSYGSYYLIREALHDFDESSISMVTESLQPNDRTYFPSVGICEIGHTKEQYEKLEQLVKRFVLEFRKAFLDKAFVSYRRH